MLSQSNAYASTEDKDDIIKDSFYEELEQTFDQFPRYHMKILLGDFNAKVGQEDIFKPTIGKESLHKISNDNCVRLENFATLKNLIFNNFLWDEKISSADSYILHRKLNRNRNSLLEQFIYKQLS